MQLNPSLIAYPWIIVGSIWLAAAGNKKPIIRRQPSPNRIFTFILLALGFAMNAGSWCKVGWLGMRFAPDTQSMLLVGFSLTIAGASFAVWARLVLGGNWSGRPSLMAGHELVTSGPYSLARHPIYTGLLLATVGTALALGEWRNIIGAVFVLLGFLFKIREEELIMMEAFPETYHAYRKRVRALVPGVF
jgi:protein-S-isoprenylcysteine O-methyltransferase Ste14